MQYSPFGGSAKFTAADGGDLDGSESVYISTTMLVTSCTVIQVGDVVLLESF
jgi:hypothetical protein